MREVKCYRCNRTIQTGNVFCINQITWCEECFNNHVLPEIKIPVEQFKTYMKKEMKKNELSENVVRPKEAVVGERE